MRAQRPHLLVGRVSAAPSPNQRRPAPGELPTHRRYRRSFHCHRCTAADAVADVVATASAGATGAVAPAAAPAAMTIGWTTLAAVDLFLLFSTAAAAVAGVARLPDVLVVAVGVGVGAVVADAAVVVTVAGGDDVRVDDGIQQFFFQMVTPRFELLLLSHRSIELGTEV